MSKRVNAKILSQRITLHIKFMKNNKYEKKRKVSGISF